MGFSFDPAVIALLLGAGTLYVRAVRVLARRGYEVPLRQQTAWHAGVGLTAVGLLSPIDGLGEELLSCLLYTSPSPRDRTRSRMPSSA